MYSNNISFVTCGIQHLSEWSIRTNTLCERHFTNVPTQSSFYVISQFERYILTGCEKGNIYLWKHRTLLHQLKAHSGPIRSLQKVPDSNTIISGGLDSYLCICRLQ